MGFGKRTYGVDIALSDEALDWLVKLHSGEANDADHMAFAHWRQQSYEHEAAARDAEAIWQNVGTAGNEMRREERQRKITRRSLLGGAALLLGGGVFYKVGYLGNSLSADYVSAVAEQRTVTLADGSIVYMNADTAFSIDPRPAMRYIKLHYGQATFKVAHDPKKPFVVAAGTGITQALGTEFDIDIRSEDVVVTVLSGTVGIATEDEPTILVKAGMDSRVFYRKTGKPSEPEIVDAAIETAWHRGKLIFNQRKLVDVVAELERYSHRKFIVIGDDLSAMEVTGAFDLNRPEEVLDTLAATLRVKITRLPFVTIIR
ncbi:FecR family protein [Brucellaceae bacterium C25G]